MNTARDIIHKQEAALELKTWAGVAVVGLGFTLVNISSFQMETARQSAPAPGIEPWITEMSSLLAVLLIFPFMAYASRRLIFTPHNWLRALLFNILGSVIFSALHVTLMVGMRKMLWPILMDGHYRFFGDVARESLYEYRKDLGTYFLLIGTLYLVRTLAQQSRELEAARLEAKKTGRIALKCGARTVHLPAKDFVYAMAAGNYVDVFTGAGQHFVRTSLASLQKQLEAAGIAALRIHRTRLVNASQVRETAPLGSGDMTITLQDGTALRASRRYRDNLRVLSGAAM